MVPKRPSRSRRSLQGTLDMPILRTLVMEPAQGHTIAQVVERTSENAPEDFRVVTCDRQLVPNQSFGLAKVCRQHGHSRRTGQQ